MKRSLLAFLACPVCKGSLAADLGEPEPDGEHMTGTLRCSACGRSYPITSGVPRMIVVAQEQRGPAETFGFEWQKHGQKELEPDTVFGRTPAQDVAYFLEAMQVQAAEVQGAVVLDGGCGSGQLTAELGRLGAQAVIGVDVNTAIEFPFRRCRPLPNVHIVQADLRALPFREGTFDLVWSNGVIHHIPDSGRAFVSLSKSVRPGGKLYVWVYEKRWNPFRFTKDVLDALGLQRVPLPVLLWVCRGLAALSLALHTGYRAVRALPFLRARSFRDRKTTRFRSLREFELTWFDALSPTYDRRFSEAQIMDWFRRRGFENLRSHPFKVGICGTRAR